MGIKMRPWFTYLWWVLTFGLTFMSFLPLWFQEKFILWYTSGWRGFPSFVPSTMQLFNRTCVGSIIHMAYTELNDIKQLDVDNINNNIQTLTFYYGSRDRWCPKEHYHNIKDKCPGVNAILCDKGYKHGFIMKKSYEIAHLVVGWVNQLHL